MDKKFAKLVAESRKQAQQQMLRGLQIQWKTDSTVDKYSKELRKCVSDFEDGVNDVIEKINQIDSHLEDLNTSELEQEIMAQKIEQIQKIIDLFDIEGYSNLKIWVEELDKRISDILIDRLEKTIKAWIEEFSEATDNDSRKEMISNFLLKIKMRNQTFILDPPLAEARAVLYT